MTLIGAVRMVQLSDAVNEPGIRRACWKEGAHVGLGATDFYWHESMDTVPVPHAMCIDDILATDWELVPVVLDDEEGAA